MQLQLRPYQAQSVYLLNRAINAGAHPLCVLPTGAGKSLVLAELLKQRDERVLVLSHVAELLEQDAAALRNLAPELTQSFYSAKLKEKKLGTQVVFGSVQSVYRNLDDFHYPRRLVLIDEAHLCPRKSEAMYAQVFEHFSAATRVGFTATPMRLDSGSLVEGEGAWFDTVAHQVEAAELIEQGYLLPLTGIITEQQADLDGVAKRGGEFVAEEAQEAVMRTLSLSDAVAQACQLARKRKSWLVFAAGIKHANEIINELRAQRINAEMILGETESEQRSERIERFRNGEIRALVNVGVLTTGFDAPALDCIISMRPTMSQVLWQQILGRGMRLAVGKENCLLLDFVGNLERLGGAGVVIETRDMRLPEAQEAAKLKRTNAKRTARKAPTFFDASHRDPMLSGETFEARVHKISYFVVPSRKQPGKRLMVAAYHLEDQFGRALSARQFVCVEYAGGARFHAVRWYAGRGVPAERVPFDAPAALVLARVSPQPDEVLARFDARMRSVVVERERFAA